MNLVAAGEEKSLQMILLKLGYRGTCDSVWSYLYYIVYSIYVPANDVSMYHSSDDYI